MTSDQPPNAWAERPIHTYADLALFLRGSDDSFTGDLLRLIAKADPGNRARLRAVYPRHVVAWEVWLTGPTLTFAEMAAVVPPDRPRATVMTADPAAGGRGASVVMTAGPAPGGGGNAAAQTGQAGPATGGGAGHAARWEP